MSLLAQVAAALDATGSPYALIGAGALTVHGISRATLDLDLLTLDSSCLVPRFWADLEGRGISVEVRRGDPGDSLAGVVRFRLAGQRPVDLVVGKSGWQRSVLERAERFRVESGQVPVVRAADLVLLKLYAGGPQDAWDIQQLLESGSKGELIAEVEERLEDLPSEAKAFWRRVVQPGETGTVRRGPERF